MAVCKGGADMNDKYDTVWRYYADICPQCGKEFYHTAEHVYKAPVKTDYHSYHQRYFCSWHCLRAYRKTCIDGRSSINKSRKLNRQKAEEIRTMYATDSYTKKELALIYDVSVTTIRDIIRYRLWKE